MTSPQPETTCDRFLDGRVRIVQPRKGYRAATDAVLLAAAVPAQPGQAVLDLGCGVGTAALCLASRQPGLTLCGVEIQADYAELARKNALANEAKLRVFTCDVRSLPDELRQIGFDHVMMNPPFYRSRSGPPSDNPGRDLANREQAADLAAWIEAGLRRLLPGGTLCLIQRAERLDEILIALGSTVGGTQLLPIASHPEHPAKRTIIRTVKGSRAPLTLLPPLTLHTACADENMPTRYTEHAETILRHGKELLPVARLGGSRD